MLFTLVTGASMGIGEAFARKFAETGTSLLLVARSEDKLLALAEELKASGATDVRILAEDLSREGSPERIYEFCLRENIAIDVLVNCAGLSFAGDFDKLPVGKLEEIMAVNMLALCRLTRLFLPGMIKRKGGGIMNIASIGGFQGVPGLALYSATKSFVITLTEALHTELKETGVKAVAVCPGFIQTGFLAKAGHSQDGILLPVYSRDLVVKAAIKGYKKNRLRIFPTVIDFLLVFSQRFVPRKTAVKLADVLSSARSRR
ncbi:SDR family NAD(P)-dependent oxidoreductase [Chlorobium phaeobacteroides]|uniref:Short-chain dehydrogenase/reductase SDR n=1 Tax=Chlorobium phaeobacteroides (strain DSM 266 / SMG 266 / 2430) TaxID=290317 RepID=A1BD16_CHLPD|nr:SDR family oxidoreductase [Chlorobium phaeobacteroides]ABL64293.1 short-chain dehydrogenase/reductase SDR [Chlorobium phaeobacteroides DSM 266]